MLISRVRGDLQNARMGGEEASIMAEFLSNYGLWILLGGIFVAMHMFGMGCGGHGGHQRGSKRQDDVADEHARHGAPTPTKAGATPSRHTDGCH